MISQLVGRPGKQHKEEEYISAGLVAIGWVWWMALDTKGVDGIGCMVEYLWMVVGELRIEENGEHGTCREVVMCCHEASRASSCQG